MTYNLGVVGFGHWFVRLYEGMKKTNEIKLLNVAGVSSLEDKKDRLAAIGVPDSANYYQIKAGKPLPDKFFDGIDIVHISDPNEFHAEQTLQALSMGKKVLTEKTLGVNREEFEKVLKYIESNGLQSAVYLHLHYAHKLLTLELPSLLEKFTKEYGKVVATSATFFELEIPNIDGRRLWLFSPKNGGIFMDWIHPFEVYYKGALASRFELIRIEPFIANPDYDKANPTAVHAVMEVDSPFFKPGTKADIRVAMGLKAQRPKKCMRFVFKGGQVLDLNFINSEEEYVSQNRGTWILADKIGGSTIKSGKPEGPTSSDILVKDIIELCRGTNTGFTTEDLKIIFGQQWKYQETLKSTQLITDSAELKRFVDEGMANAMGK